MDKYKRVEKARPEQENINANEIRITTKGKMRNYISYANNILTVCRTFSFFLLNAYQILGRCSLRCHFEGYGKSNQQDQ